MLHSIFIYNIIDINLENKDIFMKLLMTIKLNNETVLTNSLDVSAASIDGVESLLRLVDDISDTENHFSSKENITAISDHLDESGQVEFESVPYIVHISKL